MVLDWCGRAREDLQNNLRWQRGPVILVTVRSVLRTGPRAGLLPAECLAQRNVTTVGKSLVRVGTVADCCTVPVAATGAARRYRRGGGGGGRRRRRPHGVHGRRGGVRRRGVGHRSVVRGRHVCLCLDDHLRTLADDAALIVRHDECGVLLLGDAHVVAGVGLFHYVPRPYAHVTTHDSNENMDISFMYSSLIVEIVISDLIVTFSSVLIINIYIL